MLAEQLLKSRNSLQQREAVAKQPRFASEITDSIEPLMSGLFQRPTLKGKAVKLGTPATEADVKDQLGD